jgi:YgiT-type zinc finger domain-containing protein
MTCVICRQAVIHEGVAAVLFEHDKLRFTIKNVPARICPSCGEAFLEEEIASALLQRAHELSHAGVLETEFEFN